jgi:hypothetical protein
VTYCRVESHELLRLTTPTRTDKIGQVIPSTHSTAVSPPAVAAYTLTHDRSCPLINYYNGFPSRHFISALFIQYLKDGRKNT